MLGMSTKQVVTTLGAPASKGPAEEWDAISEVRQTWRYPSKGLELSVSLHYSTKVPQVLRSIRAKSPCALRTKRDVGIGSTIQQVRAAYGSIEEPESSEAGVRFVAGSIYGGLIFTFEWPSLDETIFWQIDRPRPEAGGHPRHLRREEGIEDLLHVLRWDAHARVLH